MLFQMRRLKRCKPLRINRQSQLNIPDSWKNLLRCKRHWKCENWLSVPKDF
jgi:hypothetical protein